MSPHLTRKGFCIAAASAVFLMAGVVTESWSLMALGMFLLTAIMASFVYFIPKSAAVRRRMLELAWWIPNIELSRGAVVPNTPFPLKIYIRNKAPFSLGWARITAIKSPSVIMEEEPPPLRLAGLSETGATCSLSVSASGHWFLHGAAMSITDALGFFEMDAYFATSLEIRVFPALSLRPLRHIRGASVGAPHQRTGAHRRKFTGFGGELREIRDHRPGDPFKQIAWAATARFRRLMVTEYESEILMNHHLVLDISSTMRDREPGRSKLDYGVDFCASFAKEALDGGDRVSLTTVDSRILGKIKLSEGRTHLYRIVEHLMEVHHVIDEDLTDLTDMELVEAVAVYLLYQEGFDVRLRNIPPPGHDLWKEILVGPSGQIFNVNALASWAKGVLNRLKQDPQRAPNWLKLQNRSPSKKPKMASLRQICRLKGINVPYRTGFLPENKAGGIARAIRFIASTHRSHHIVLVTDLMGIQVKGALKASIELARRRHNQVTVLCPFAPMFGDEKNKKENSLLHRVFAADEMKNLSPVFRELATLGVKVEMGSPNKVARTLGIGSSMLNQTKVKAA